MKALLLIAGATAAMAGQISSGKVVDWTDKQVQKNLPTKEERRIDEVGWAGSVLEAVRLSAQHGRPVYLFEHDGDMATGRC